MIMRVPFIDPSREFEKIGRWTMQEIESVVRNGDFLFREQTQEFERRIADMTGVKHAIAVSCCTSGMELALQAAGIGAGDECITVSHTYCATFNAIVAVGAKPVLIDVGEDFNMDPALIEAAITPKTKAIFVVHLNGRVARMPEIMEIAKRRGLTVFEDSAQAFGATLNGQVAGSFGIASSFSFHWAKVLGGYGEGGAVTTNDDSIARRVRSMRSHGELAAYLRTPGAPREIYEHGHGFLPDNLQCAIVVRKMKYLKGWITRRRAIAARYEKGLSGKVPVLTPPLGKGDVFQNYVIRAERRDELAEYLEKRGVGTIISWPVPNHRQPALKALHKFQLPFTEKLSKEVLSLPCYPFISNPEIKYVVQTILDFYARG